MDMIAILAQDGIGGEVIVWLIIAFFWVVAQLFSRSKDRGRARQSPPERKQPATEEEARTLEQEMRRFFEELGAEPPAVKEVQPATPPPMPRQREIRPAQGTRRRDSQQRVRLDAQPRPDVMPRQPVDISLGAIDTKLDESALDTELAYQLPSTDRQESINAFVNPRTLLVNLNYLRMNMPIIPITGLSTTDERRPRPHLQSRAALRNAITTQLILSNPLAMGEDKGSYTKRIV